MIINISEFLTFFVEMKYHPYVSGRRGSKRIPDVVQKERWLKTLVSWFLSLVP